MNLSVVIVNYNVKYFLEQCLHSVRKATAGMELEIWVVDNHSVDGSIEMVQQKFPEVKLIVNKENLGFSKANNQAIRQATGEFILLLNPDTVVQEDTFTKTIKFMQSHHDAGGLGVKMIDGKGKYLPESKRGLPSPRVAFYKMLGLAAIFPKSKQFGEYHLGYLDKNTKHKIAVLSGAFMLLRKSVLDQIGLLDETFFMYGEDVDLSYRITKAGYKNYYFPDTTIIHYKGESTKKSSVNYVFVFYRAMAIFAQKHFSKNIAGLFGFLIETAIWARAGVALMHRTLQRFSVPFADAALIATGFILLMDYYAAEVKFGSGASYSTLVKWVNVPIYTMLWLGGAWLNRCYEADSRFFKLLRGVVLGTLGIAVAYAFANEDFRFSRALILVGACWALTAMIITRLASQWIRYRRFGLAGIRTKNTIILGNQHEAARVRDLLNRTAAPSRFVGFVTLDEPKQKDENWLGNLQNINEVVEVFGVEEIIFCSKDITVQDIIKTMGTVDAARVEFKIVPEQSLYIIGSNSKNGRGDFYTIDISLDITRPNNRRSKRAFDLAVSILLILLSPILAPFNRNPLRYFANLFSVIEGKATLVGYTPCPNPEELPALKPGILSPMDGQKHKQGTGSTAYKLNLIYAKNYSVENDLMLVLRNVTGLSRYSS